MRRMVGLLVTAGAVVALAGVAVAETAPGRDGVDGTAAGGGPANGVVDQLLGAAVPAAGLGETGRRRIGTVERVTRLLGAAGGTESTTLRYPGASYVKVHLKRAALRRGEAVTVADPAGTEVHRYTAPDLRDPTGRWAMSVTGDTAVVTLHRAAGPLGLGRVLGGDGVEVDRVARGFSQRENAAHRQAERQRGGAGGPRTGREESVCGSNDASDAVCYRTSDPVAYRRSKAIVRLLINGNELCTGWRVGPNNRLVTNNHCFDSSRTAYQTEVWFNYQCARCDGFEVFRPTKVWGDRVLVTDRTLDLTVFTVENFAAVREFGQLDLDTARPARGDGVYIPQHPGGDPTVIATSSDTDRAGNCAVVDPAYDGYAAGSDVSYYCDTEGGSSGSPVLSRRTGRVIALHHFGGCPNSGVRADLIQRRIGHVL
ncbi:MAG TPA: serine protease [Pilimelia sp.]|nr:serine protease [Pilimelia sp.]